MVRTGEARPWHKPVLNPILESLVMTTLAPSTARETDECHLGVEDAVPVLVGALYDAAPPAERSRLLEYLLPPMGVLALVSVANGVFANIRFGGRTQSGQVPMDAALKVQGGEVAALVDRLQMTSVEAVDGLAQWVMASPGLAGTAAAALLLALLSQRARARQKRAGFEPGAARSDGLVTVPLGKPTEKPSVRPR